VIFTGELAKDPQTLIYLGCLQVAAGAADIKTIEHREIKA
jgi:hypothetical protein